MKIILTYRPLLFIFVIIRHDDLRDQLCCV